MCLCLLLSFEDLELVLKTAELVENLVLLPVNLVFGLAIRQLSVLPALSILPQPITVKFGLIELLP